MTVRSDIREVVRARARFACEYCGVRESDAGDLLTIDLFQPIGKGGDHSVENLVYCCVRCNQYKGDYWPASSSDPALWSPRRETASVHMVELDDGSLEAQTQVGAFSIALLHLNRPALVAYRQRRRRALEEGEWLERYQQLAIALQKLVEQQSQLVKQQRVLLAEQRELLKRLFVRKE